MAEVGTGLVFENQRVRVWEFTVQPGEEVSRHTHAARNVGATRYHEVLVELK